MHLSRVEWVFNGTSTEKGQFVKTVGEGNNVKQFTVKHSSYINAAMQHKCLSHQMTYLLIIMFVPSPMPGEIPHTVFDIISLGVEVR